MRPSTLAVIIVVLLIPVVALIVSQRDKGSSATTPPTSASASPSASPTTAVQPVTKASDLKDPADAVSASQVVLKTVKGDITINLFPADAPKTVENFVTLGKRGYYNGIYFHRILQDFVIQAGDPTGTGAGGESIFGAKFPDELNSHKYSAGTLGMANSGANTNGSQFFIATKSISAGSINALNSGGYTVFGQIDPASQPVVDALAAVKVDDPSTGKPVNPTDAKITGFSIVK